MQRRNPRTCCPGAVWSLCAHQPPLLGVSEHQTTACSRFSSNMTLWLAAGGHAKTKGSVTSFSMAYLDILNLNDCFCLQLLSTHLGIQRCLIPQTFVAGSRGHSLGEQKTGGPGVPPAATRAEREAAVQRPREPSVTGPHPAGHPPALRFRLLHTFHKLGDFDKRRAC